MGSRSLTVNILSCVSCDWYFCRAVEWRWTCVYPLIQGPKNSRGERKRKTSQRYHLSVAVCRPPDWLHGEKRRDSTAAMLHCPWSSFSTSPVIVPFLPTHFLPISPSLRLSLCLPRPSRFTGLRSLHHSNLSLWQDKALFSHEPFPPLWQVECWRPWRTHTLTRLMRVWPRLT